jgi:predicted DNA-binding transcriptional regulator AlpA
MIISKEELADIIDPDRKGMNKMTPTKTKQKDLSLPLEGFARPAQVAFALGVCRATLYNYIRQGKFPEPERDGKRITRWPVAVIRECLKRQGGSVFEPSGHPDSQPTSAS